MPAPIKRPKKTNTAKAQPPLGSHAGKAGTAPAKAPVKPAPAKKATKGGNKPPRPAPTPTPTPTPPASGTGGGGTGGTNTPANPPNPPTPSAAQPTVATPPGTQPGGTTTQVQQPASPTGQTATPAPAPAAPPVPRVPPIVPAPNTPAPQAFWQKWTFWKTRKFWAWVSVILGVIVGVVSLVSHFKHKSSVTDAGDFNPPGTPLTNGPSRSVTPPALQQSTTASPKPVIPVGGVYINNDHGSIGTIKVYVGSNTNSATSSPKRWFNRKPDKIEKILPENCVASAGTRMLVPKVILKGEIITFPTPAGWAYDPREVDWDEVQAVICVTLPTGPEWFDRQDPEGQAMGRRYSVTAWKFMSLGRQDTTIKWYAEAK